MVNKNSELNKRKKKRDTKRKNRQRREQPCKCEAQKESKTIPNAQTNGKMHQQRTTDICATGFHRQTARPITCMSLTRARQRPFVLAGADPARTDAAACLVPEAAVPASSSDRERRVASAGWVGNMHVCDLEWAMDAALRHWEVVGDTDRAAPCMCQVQDAEAFGRLVVRHT